MDFFKSRIYVVNYLCDYEVFINKVEIFRWGRERWYLILKSYMVVMVFRSLRIVCVRKE